MSDSWTLQIRYTQLRDIGEYQCQVNTEPKISLSIFLSVSGKNFCNLPNCTWLTQCTWWCVQQPIQILFLRKCWVVELFHCPWLAANVHGVWCLFYKFHDNLVCPNQRLPLAAYLIMYNTIAYFKFQFSIIGLAEICLKQFYFFNIQVHFTRLLVQLVGFLILSKLFWKTFLHIKEIWF